MSHLSVYVLCLQIDEETDDPTVINTSNPAEARMRKIERFKREKEAKQRLKVTTWLCVTVVCIMA